MELHTLALIGILVAAQQPAQPPEPPATQPKAQTGIEGVNLGVSLNRIQEAVQRPPAILPETSRPVFRIEILERKPTLEEILGSDYLRGPVPAAGLSHQEFLNMVTPEEFRGMAMFTNKEAMTIAATSLALQWALLKAVDTLKQARTERAKEAARQEVAEAMRAIEEARRKKGGEK